MKKQIVHWFGLLFLVFTVCLVVTSCDSLEKKSDLSSLETTESNMDNTRDSSVEIEANTSMDIQVSDHDHIYELVMLAPPSCGVEGRQVYECVICGKRQHETSVAALPHNYKRSDALSTWPTCTATGKQVYSCSTCGYTQSEVLEATGHEWFTKSSCDSTTNELLITPYCTRCALVSQYTYRYKVNDVTKLTPSSHNIFGESDYTIIGNSGNATISKAPYYAVYCNATYLLIVRSTQKITVDDFSVGSLMSDPLRFYTSRGCTVVLETDISITADGRIRIVQ